MEDEIRVTVIATGFDEPNQPDAEQAAEEKKPAEEKPAEKDPFDDIFAIFNK